MRKAGASVNQRTHRGKTYVKTGTTGFYVRPRHMGQVDITKLVDGEEMLYLRRWYLFRCKWFSIRLHHIVLPDVDHWPHDHPWPFVAIVLRGGYDEVWDGPGHWKPRKIKRVVRINAHRATDVHRIVRFHRGDAGAWTLFLTGRERREWGFTMPGGWMAWHEALARGLTS